MMSNTVDVYEVVEKVFGENVIIPSHTCYSTDSDIVLKLSLYRERRYVGEVIVRSSVAQTITMYVLERTGMALKKFVEKQVNELNVVSLDLVYTCTYSICVH